MMTSDRWGNAVFCVALVYILFISSFTLEQNIRLFAISVVCLAQTTILWMLPDKGGYFAANQPVYRPKASSGIFGSLLVPMTMLGEVVAIGKLEETESEVWLSLVAAASSVSRFVILDLPHRKLLLFFTTALAGSITVLTTKCFSVLVAIDFFIVWKGLEVVPTYLQRSFTYGELSIVLQLIMGWSDKLVLSLFKTSKLAEEDQHLLWFVCTLVIAVIFATWTVYVTSSNSSIGRFLAVYIFFAIISLVILYVRLEEQPILWLINFLWGSCAKIYLLITWIILLAVTVVWTVTRGLAMQPPVHNQKTEKTEVGEKKSKGFLRAGSSLHLVSLKSSWKRNGVSFTTRKVFHVFIVLVYIPGIMLDTRLLLLASAAVLGLFVILEAARALQVPVIGKHLDDILRMFVDDRDQGVVFLTHIYLLVGMSLPLWISHNQFSSSKASIEMYSGVLSLGVGDTVACVAGRMWGRVQWPGSNKTVEGTLSSIVSQMLLIVLGIYCGVVTVNNLVTVSIGVTLCALAEAFTDQIDNIVLPLVLYPFLCMS